MYLKSLEMHGFKSFPNHTTLNFNNGTTVIVGPNGSGKSNITDAMRWVLGELSSKNIRGSKMEDVIFVGTDDKKPMSFAEVSVTFDDSEEPRSLNCGYDEVTVTRRYYRSGDSEYFINKKKARLKDIYELFMNTGIGREGYSIIGQGKIAEIISKKSEDRRGVFEESAGIAKYRHKKRESEKKLAETESNMERVSDIERELGSRIGPLERDSAKARQYLELYNEKKKSDVSLWLYDSERIKVSINKAENDTKLSAHELEMAEDSLKITSAKIERMYDQSHDNKEASRKNYEETGIMTKRMSDAESESRVLTKEKIHSEQIFSNEEHLYDDASNSIVRENEKISSLKEKLANLMERSAESCGEHDSLQEKINSIKNTANEYSKQLDELFAKQKKAEAELMDLRVRQNVLESNISNQNKRTENINSDIEKYESEIESLKKQAEAADRQIEDYRKLTSEMSEKISECEAKSESISAEFEKADSVMRGKQSEVDSLESRITALKRMQEHFDGYNNSIKFIMKEAAEGRLKGIRGPISYLIKVEKKYIVAIETTLGAALQNIVTDDEGSAKASIESLKRNNEGRATFYPLTTIRPQERGKEYDGLENSTGFIGWGDELVSCDSEYKNIIKSLLARVVVYDTLDNASAAAKSKGWRIRAVTLDGQQINSGGSFTGGQTKRDSGILSRSHQIDALNKELISARSELEKLGEESKSLKDKVSSYTAESRSLADRRGLIEALINTEEKSKSDANGRIDALSSLVSSMYQDSKTLLESSSRSSEDLEKMQADISSKNSVISEISAERDSVAALRGECELQIAEFEENLNKIRIQIAEFMRDKEAIDNSIEESSERLQQAISEKEAHKNVIDELRKRITSLENSAREKLEEAEELRVKIEELQNRQRSLDEIGDNIEMEINSLRKIEVEQNSTKELAFISHSKNEAKLNSLKEEEVKLASKLWDDYEFTYASAVKFAEENDCHRIVEGERTEYQNIQNELKRKIKALGHVNVEAIEEYKEVKQRYDYIKTQLEDLRASREDLLKILSGIESDMKDIFLDAFEKINKNFGEVFRELFGGGHAEVILTDPENALESGIEINAAPPGKTIKNLNLLSGGEQAFIAIALLFALIKFNPSPFCIFDEIEAALDEVNVTRVGKYVKNYSKEMQIIMISHRRGTMDIADTLYGVTMPQSGISQVFTLESSDNSELLLK